MIDFRPYNKSNYYNHASICHYALKIIIITLTNIVMLHRYYLDENRPS
jgi:hypothetical protein